MKKFFVVFSVLAMMALSTLTVSAISGEGTEESPFIITSEEEMALLADFPDCYFELGNDVELTEEWIASDFSGNFNGNNHTITVSRFGTATRGGLFATMSGTVENLKVVTENATFGKFTYFGIIAGECSGNIKNCNTSGKISLVEYKNYVYYGGIVGYCSNNGNIENCSSNIYLDAMVSYDQHWSSIGGTTVTSGKLYYGGICGQLLGKINQCASINDLNLSLSSGYYNAVVYYGGIAGYIRVRSASIQNSYSINSIENSSGDGYFTYSGIAYNEYSGTITNCYATSESPSNADEICGIASKGTMTNCFYDKDTSGQTSTSYGTPKSTLAMKMKATYKNWDFDTIWGIDENINNGYPHLLYELDSMDNSISFDTEIQEANVFVNKAGTYTVVFADYDGTMFNDADVQSLTLKKGYNSISTTLILTDGDKVFLWKDMDTLVPISESENVLSE